MYKPCNSSNNPLHQSDMVGDRNKYADKYYSRQQNKQEHTAFYNPFRKNLGNFCKVSKYEQCTFLGKIKQLVYCFTQPVKYLLSNRHFKDKNCQGNLQNEACYHQPVIDCL